MSDVTRIFARIESGDPAAAAELLPLVYEELRRLAAAKLAQEKPGQTLSATALVHDAYLRLVGGGNESGDLGLEAEAGVSADHSLAPNPHSPVPAFHSRGHFFAAAAEAMRWILVDNARKKATQRRGGGMSRQQLLDSDIAEAAPPAEVIGVHEALDALAAEDSLTAELIKLRYFGGFSLEEAGELLGMSRATAYRVWTYGRAWLRAELTDDDKNSA